MPTVKCLAPWFGSNRMLGAHVGRLLGDCAWVGVGFAGGMAELLHLKARTLVVNDLHAHVIHLARVVADPKLGPLLYRRLRRVPLHPLVLEAAQRFCAAHEPDWQRMTDDERLNCAEFYFVACWQARSGLAGTDGEFRGGVPVRWEASGGDSAVRYQSAIRSLVAWRRVLSRATFTTLDIFEFLRKAKDREGHGLYIDPPFPGAGDVYRHKFDADKQRALAAAVANFRNTRVVIRYYDHPLIRELYADWHWTKLAGRKQTNDSAPEVLITNFAPEAIGE